MSRKVSVRVLDGFSLLSSLKTKDMPCHKSQSNQRLDHCEMYSFYDNDGEEFYNPNTPTLMPSEDIWKKFELLPTPPRSPRRDGILDEFSDIADFFVNDSSLKLPNLPFPETPPLNSSLCSKLIQDCMWSGSHTLSSCSSTEKLGSVTAPTSGDSLDLSNTSDCVDPAAVFPYPISDTQIHNLGTETPSDSEEEIDVVSTPDDSALPAPSCHTVFNTGNIKTVTVTTESTKPKVQPKSVQLVIECPQVTGHHNYSLTHSQAYKRTRSVYHQTHFVPKRIKRELSLPDLKSACKKLNAARDSVRNNSDSDEFCEGVKRTQHNVLERKRRNDLKYSFFTLRDNVPDLNDKDKAPKVLILKKAADHILELRRQDVKLAKELTVVKDRHEALRKTLSCLRH
ncbi:myc protein-like [Gigantopelta aegis]|uniref:myc protein-like n=1 Tax=Gigantopelta aegis TaxID=1735272 RepID=UPI001B888199|nr:myc protein-like [Gigantopelta aegis]